MYNKILRESKKLFFSRQLQSNANNLKKTWEILNEAINKRKPSSLIDSLKIYGKIETDPQKMADQFNKFFTSIATEIATSINPVIPIPVPTVETLLADEDKFSMSSNPVSQLELSQALNKLLDKRSLDLNNISMYLFKKIIHVIQTPLLHIFNRSLVTGIVPSKFKVVKVVPIFKSGDTSDMNNYRPISLICNFCKILEKIVFLRLSDFLAEKNIISPEQFGFRPSHSTIHPMTQILNAAASTLNAKKHMLIIFCDLKKAFDTCNIGILLKKMQKMGITGTELLWFESFLTDRKQYVSINFAKALF